MKRKILGFVLIFCMLSVFVPYVTVTAEYIGTQYGEYLYYEINDKGTITIMDCNEHVSGELTIPSEIDGISVTEIGDEAFRKCSSLTSIIIPDSITKIGSWAFDYCTALTNIFIPKSIITIGSGIFYDCPSIISIDVDNANTQYTSDNGILFNKDKTVLLRYPAGKDSETYSIPNYVTNIGYLAFMGCSSLKNIDVSDSVEYIGSYAFQGCTSLTGIFIPKSVSHIGDGAFAWCGNTIDHIDVDIENPDYSSDNGILFNKDKTILIQYPAGNPLTSYTTPDSVTEISSHAFGQCNSLLSIIIPNATSIGFSAFYRCSSLKNIYIPNCIVNIASQAFSDCSSLADVYYGGLKDNWNNIEIGNFNDQLSNALIHFNAVGINPPNIIGTPLINENSLDISLTNVEYDSDLITVFYNNSKMISVVNTPISSGDTTKSIILPDNGENQAKVFIWDSLEGMRPLCESKNVTVR